MIEQMLLKDLPIYQAFFQQHPRVYFYGAGEGATRMMQYAEENGLRKPDGVLVGDGQAHEDQFY